MESLEGGQSVSKFHSLHIVTCGTKSFTLILILSLIMFQISSFPDSRAPIQQGYGPILSSPSDNLR